MTTYHTVIVTFRAKPDRSEDFRATMKSVGTDLPKIAGCIGVRVFQDTANAHGYTLVEEWETQQMHSDHIDNLVASGGWASIEEMLSEPPETLIVRAI